MEVEVEVEVTSCVYTYFWILGGCVISTLGCAQVRGGSFVPALYTYILERYTFAVYALIKNQKSIYQVKEEYFYFEDVLRSMSNKDER